jgi:hypothetical protein
MTAIWRNDGGTWSILAPVGFPNEAALHSLVEEAPHLLPLAGNPRLTVVGREVLLGNGYADLIAIEPTGRIVVIEVKLARNAEARRAVVAQVLTYAAFLRGLTPDTLEQKVLGAHLQKRKFTTLADAAASNYQEGTLDVAEFTAGLTQSLTEGRFRLVLVLDESPEELVRLVGYLAAIADKVLIDLVTVSSYQVGESQVLVPQRVDPEYQPAEPASASAERASKGQLVEGAADFAESIEQAKSEHRDRLREMYEWALSIEREGLARLSTYHGRNGATTLLPRLRADDAGLVTIYNDGTGGSIQFWRSVFERRAPIAMERVEQAAGTALRQGNTTKAITSELFTALSDAYREAALGRIAQTVSIQIEAQQ